MILFLLQGILTTFVLLTWAIWCGCREVCPWRPPSWWPLGRGKLYPSCVALKPQWKQPPSTKSKLACMISIRMPA
jgi:hypothetical protein